MAKGIKNYLKIELVLLVLIGIVVIVNHFYLGNVSAKLDNALTPLSSSSVAAAETLELAPGAIEVQFYVMSQCPYGVQVEDAIKPVLDTLGNNVDFKLDFIGNGVPGAFQSLHGQPEVDGNKVQICAAKYFPGSYMEMVACMNKNMKAIPGNWEECAASAGLDLNTVRTCYEGGEGDELLAESFQKASAAGARGSPTIFVNGEPYKGGRTAEAFQQAICAEFSDAPEACGEVVAAAAPELKGSC
ncbi:thioredoxin domain-containing protein [Candidatus Woesearchaeota archaeon]|jgi:glutaredoxin|nr:thioredoxin domain-containing protein [Candidatus Woesearchaeota archaeon]